MSQRNLNEEFESEISEERLSSLIEDSLKKGKDEILEGLDSDLEIDSAL